MALSRPRPDRQREPETQAAIDALPPEERFRHEATEDFVAFRRMTQAQLDAWIDANTGNVVELREVVRMLFRMVVAR